MKRKSSINDDRNRKKEYIKVCPMCLKKAKIKRLNDGYIICFWCGLVLYKQPYSLEPIDAPGFLKIEIKKNENKINNSHSLHDYCNTNNHHHKMKTIHNFINNYHKNKHQIYY